MPIILYSDLGTVWRLFQRRKAQQPVGLDRMENRLEFVHVGQQGSRLRESGRARIAGPKHSGFVSEPGRSRNRRPNKRRSVRTSTRTTYTYVGILAHRLYVRNVRSSIVRIADYTGWCT